MIRSVIQRAKVSLYVLSDVKGIGIMLLLLIAYCIVDQSIFEFAVSVPSFISWDGIMFNDLRYNGLRRPFIR